MINDAKRIIEAAISDAKPNAAVKSALKDIRFKGGKRLLVSIGKAAWEMAKAATEEITFDDGIVITKYNHSNGILTNIDIYEAGHPVPDKNTYLATKEALRKVEGLTEEDNILFLISGGGSALFESPLVSEEEMANITKQLLASGANIVEMNTIRKRLSAVKGGKFALSCMPANIFTIVLSDIIGDPLDMIASGPAYPDYSTCEEAKNIVNKYKLNISEEAMGLLEKETPKDLSNVTTFVTGSVKGLCKSAERVCKELGYEPKVLTTELSCEAKDAGTWIGKLAKEEPKKPTAFIAGGETVVHLTGKGKGGRNQEIALAAAREISGLKDVVVFSVGSDGTDGPTDAAGGIVTGETTSRLKSLGIEIDEVLKENDAYNALKKVDGLVITGPTGTNVNDLSVALIR